MKKIIIAILLHCSCNIVQSQNITNEPVPFRQAKTSLGTLLEFSSYNSVKNGYVATVTQRYYDVIDQMNVFTSISIYEYDIDQFKKEIFAVHDYYERWSDIAEKNHIDYIEKEIPIKITTIKNIGCYAYAWNADKISVKFFFKVYNNKPICDLNISLGFLNRRFYATNWQFCEQELLGFIEEIENVILRGKRFDTMKKRKQELFN